MRTKKEVFKNINSITEKILELSFNKSIKKISINDDQNKTNILFSDSIASLYHDNEVISNIYLSCLLPLLIEALFDIRDILKGELKDA